MTEEENRARAVQRAELIKGRLAVWGFLWQKVTLIIFYYYNKGIFVFIGIYFNHKGTAQHGDYY